MKKVGKGINLTVFIILLLLMSAGAVFLLKEFKVGQREAEIVFAPDKIEVYKDLLGETRSKIETSNKNNSAFTQSEIDSLKRALGIKEKQIKEITQIKGKLIDSLKLVSLSLDAEKHKVWNWEHKYKKGSKVVATMSEKDSALHVQSDIALTVTDYVDNTGFLGLGKRIRYTDIYSADRESGILINGVKTYRTETEIKRQKIGIGLQAGYGIQQDGKIKPYIGIGVSYNFISF